MTIGKVTLREPVIDYTEVAQPLTFDDIANDLTRVNVQYALSTGHIVMWEHQWNWLAQQAPAIRDAADFQRKSIFGVKVEIK